MRGFWQAALAAAALACAGQAAAIQGTFMLADGSRSLTVEEDGANLVVGSLLADSVFTPDGHGAYEFRTAGPAGAHFYLRVHDESTIEVGQVGTATPMIMRKVDPATAKAALEAHKAYVALAEHYALRARWDSDNEQVWTVCAAIVHRRSKGDDAEFAEYARQGAQLLRTILVSPDENPCEDAIPPQYW